MLVHTDFGHDPDDCIALAYLIEHGCIPNVISITPGWDQQISALTGFLNCYDIFPTICCSKNCESNEKFNTGGHRIFPVSTAARKFMYLTHVKFQHFQDQKALIIGPALNLGGKLKCEELYFQGGYSPNSVNPLSKFEGIEAVQSFNPSGAKSDFNKLLETPDIRYRYYIGKNVCHGFTKENLGKIWIPKNKIVRKFWDNLKPNKKMHDVLAAMLCLNKDLGIWENATPVWRGSKLTTMSMDLPNWSLIGIK